MSRHQQAVTHRRIRREFGTVRVMIEIHCRGHHAPSREDRLCDACRELREYTQARVGRCPFGEDKPTCVNCAVH